MTRTQVMPIHITVHDKERRGTKAKGGMEAGEGEGRKLLAMSQLPIETVGTTMHRPGHQQGAQSGWKVQQRSCWLGWEVAQ